MPADQGSIIIRRSLPHGRVAAMLDTRRSLDSIVFLVRAATGRAISSSR